MSRPSITISPEQQNNLFSGSMKDHFMKAANNGATHVLEIEVCHRAGHEFSAPFRLAFISLTSKADQHNACNEFEYPHMPSNMYYAHSKGCRPIEDFYGPIRKPFEKIKKNLHALLS